MPQWSVTMRNARLAAYISTIGPSPVINMYGGTVPANCAASLGANNLSGNPVLATFALAATWMGEPANGAANALNTPLQTTGNSVAAGGTDATFYRILDSSGNCQEQGTVGESGSGDDVIVANVSIASGQIVQISAFSRTEPGA